MKKTTEREKADRHEANPWREAGSLVVAVGLLAGLAYYFVRDQLSMQHAPTPIMVDVKSTTKAQVERCGMPSRDGRPVVISMLYSEDKQPWVEQAANHFARLCPLIQVKLTAMGDIESANAILAGEQQPTLWSPADDLVLRYLDARWKAEKRTDKPIFDFAAQISLISSPLVVLMWDDRHQVVEKIMATRGREQGQWAEFMCAAIPEKPNLEGMVIDDMIAGTWSDWYGQVSPPPEKKPAVAPRRAAARKPEEAKNVYRAPFPSFDQIQSWGHVKIGHTSPTRSATGLEVLYLMAYDHVLPPRERPESASKAAQDAIARGDVAGRVVTMDVNKAEFQRAFAERKQALGTWLKRCEAGLETAPSSARLLTDTMFDVGASRYDAVVTYEHLTFGVLAQIDEFSKVLSDMRIIYPQPTIMNQHPVVFLELAGLTDVQRLYAVKWIEFLRSEEMQKQAIEHGFRPASPEVSIRDYASMTNPFLGLRRYGVRFDFPIIEPPRLDGGAIHELIRTWQDATGRN